jgi:hypothetical protein
MKTFVAKNGHKINVSSNKSKRRFIILVDGFRSDTTRLTKDEFEKMLNFNGEDWENFLVENIM